MTYPRRTTAAIDEALTGARHLLLDFDGVICQLYPAHSTDRAKVADRIRAELTSRGVRFPDVLAEAEDPVAVLAYAYLVSPDLAKEAETTLTHWEVAAVPAAEPVGHVLDVIASAQESGRAVTIVSSCAEPAVNAYLDRAAVTSLFGSVVARAPDDMQCVTASGLIARCLTLLAANPAECALVTARPDLLRAATEVGIAVLAYGHDPVEPENTGAWSPPSVTSLADLVLRLRARPLKD